MYLQSIISSVLLASIAPLATMSGLPSVATMAFWAVMGNLAVSIS